MKMKKFLAFAFACLAFIACKDVVRELKDDANNDGRRDWIPEPDANPVLTTADVIAYRNGLEAWNAISEIKFTFNVDRGDQHFERSYVWEPKTNKVVYMSLKDTVVYYQNSQLDSLQIAADQAFINDKYWLLAPFNLVWDKGTTISEKKNQIAPISKDTLNMLTIIYGEEGGYTPGDAYDFFFGKDYIIKEWVFRKGNDTVPSLTTTWEDYGEFNGLKIARMHKDATGNFKLYFTTISVK